MGPGPSAVCYNGRCAASASREAMVNVTSYVELELSLSHLSGPNYRAECRFSDPTGQADAFLVNGLKVTLDGPRLLALASDPQGYGAALTGMLFAEGQMREAWRHVQGYCEGANKTLRLRLRLDAQDGFLHSLRWETLQDPGSGVSLSRSGRVLLSRYIEGDGLARVVAPARSQLRTLLVVASPSNLKEYGLAPLDVEAEIALARRSLGPGQVVVIARAAGAPATADRLAAALHEGHSVVYLVCHGLVRDDASLLFLENERGEAHVVDGQLLVDQIDAVADGQRPLLMVLAACHSSGASHSEAVLGAMGPRLARSGVPAVVGMADRMPVSSADRFLPVLFAELARHGEIDRAVAVARVRLLDDHAWWQPVLFTRVRDGRIWRAASGQGLDPAWRPGPTPFVDRTAERALFGRMLRREVPEQGLIIHSCGEGGWGKSYLVKMFLAECGAAPEPAPVTLYFDPGDNGADRRLIMDRTVRAVGEQHFQRYLGLQRGLAPGAAGEAYREAPAPAAELGERTPAADPDTGPAALGPAMGEAVREAAAGAGPSSGSAPPRYGEPSAQDLIEAFFEDLRAVPAGRSLVWLVDSAQDLDRETVLWLQRVFGRIATGQAPGLILVVAGREQLPTRPGWEERVAVIDLRRFDREAVIELMDSMGLGDSVAGPLFESYYELLVDKTRSKPLEIVAQLQKVRR